MELGWELISENFESKLGLSERWYQLILHMIKEVGLKFSEKSILEVGCGIGGFCFWARRKCENVAGLDIAKTRIKRAKDLGKNLEKPNFIAGDAQFLPFKDKSFDIVVCSETLEHIPNFIRAFNELVRVTRKGGYLILTVPNFVNMTWLYKPLELLISHGRKGQPSDLHYFSIFTINSLFERRDLRIETKLGIGLIGIHKSIFKLIPAIKPVENKLNKPRKNLMSLCINIGIIAQKIF
jgi:SAM-dependent methyltransferase